jgi:F-type H+-transporting ATPase subunit epsilon
MKLRILLPTEVVVDEEVHKVVAEAVNGSFCLLENHVDFVAALVPGILSFEADAGETYMAVDEGILVKVGHEVFVSTRNAVRGPELGPLRRTIKEQFEVMDEREKTTRSATARIEAGFVRRFLEFQERG